MENFSPFYCYTRRRPRQRLLSLNNMVHVNHDASLLFQETPVIYPKEDVIEEQMAEDVIERTMYLYRL